MKTIITFSTLLINSILFAQTTYTIDWAVGISNEEASITIEVGDTVEWIWADALPHTVTSEGDAVEQFDSGILTGIGQTFSYTFTVVGDNSYRCDVHSSMDGTITVVPSLGIESKFEVNLNYYPNPVRDQLTVTSLFDLDSYTIYDIQGKRIAEEKVETNILNIDLSTYTSGIYFVKVSSNDLSKTLKVLKK